MKQYWSKGTNNRLFFDIQCLGRSSIAVFILGLFRIFAGYVTCFDGERIVEYGSKSFILREIVEEFYQQAGIFIETIGKLVKI
ncbi:hypothetical protein [uncultured Proteiniphilum sp.]|uniref:hypothetical protein n=1 Tax=uncultured Proteiniphilum sp. TaxID=497637 RepID=UPI00263600BD|nr:hypothetical protein [uncultured Proteiniphilum sp.]